MSVELVSWTPDHDKLIIEREKLLQLQEAKLRARGNYPIPVQTQILPGEPIPSIDYGEEDAAETTALVSYKPAMLSGGLSSWLTSPNGKLRQTLVLPGEKAPIYYESHYAPHRKANFRSNAMQFLMPKNMEGGIDYARPTDFGFVDVPYTNPRGPFMSRHLHTDPTHHKLLVGARHMDAIMEGANAFGMNQRMFGCPLPTYAQPTDEEVATKRRRLQAHFNHVKSMKGVFSPATLNHVANTENAFMTSLTNKVDAKMTSDVVQQLANTVPGIDGPAAEGIVKGLQNTYTQRFGAMVPNTQVPFTIYKSEVWHPEAHGLDSEGKFSFVGDMDYTSKGTRLFGTGLAIRYGDAKNHVFSNVYTKMMPEGQPLSNQPIATTWYPHADGSDAYVMEPAGNPQYRGVVFSAPMSGSSGLAFLSV